MFKFNLEISEGKEVRAVINNKLEFSTKPVTVFDNNTGKRETVTKSIYEQVYDYYVKLRGKQIDEEVVKELCVVLEESKDIDEITKALAELSTKI